MDEVRRLEYLNAMGIPTWVPRAGDSRSTAHVPASLRGVQDADAVPPVVVDAMPDSDDQPPPWVVDESIPMAMEPVELASEEQPVSTGNRGETIARMEWEPLREAVRACEGCGLHATRTQAVFGVGNPDARWMIVGEAPGADEDRMGEPFVGRAGKLLDKMLRAVGLDRSEVFIANVLKCRPPGNRDPAAEESAACRPYLERQIQLVAPRVILSVGRISAQNLLESDTAVGRLRGRIHRFGNDRIPLIVTYHPAYLLRKPIEKRKVWEDLKLAVSVVEGRSA